jgi:hypothetical protein
VWDPAKPRGAPRLAARIHAPPDRVIRITFLIAIGFYFADRRNFLQYSARRGNLLVQGSYLIAVPARNNVSPPRMSNHNHAVAECSMSFPRRRAPRGPELF